MEEKAGEVWVADEFRGGGGEGLTTSCTPIGGERGLDLRDQTQTQKQKQKKTVSALNDRVDQSRYVLSGFGACLARLALVRPRSTTSSFSLPTTLGVGGRSRVGRAASLRLSRPTGLEGSLLLSLRGAVGVGVEGSASLIAGESFRTLVDWFMSVAETG